MAGPIGHKARAASDRHSVDSYRQELILVPRSPTASELIQASKNECCLCGLANRFTWSVPLLCCKQCWRNYHADCHVPTLKSPVHEPFFCSKCRKASVKVEQTSSRSREPQPSSNKQSGQPLYVARHSEDKLSHRHGQLQHRPGQRPTPGQLPKTIVAKQYPDQPASLQRKNIGSLGNEENSKLRRSFELAERATAGGSGPTPQSLSRDVSPPSLSISASKQKKGETVDTGYQEFRTTATPILLSTSSLSSSRYRPASERKPVETEYLTGSQSGFVMPPNPLRASASLPASRKDPVFGDEDDDDSGLFPSGVIFDLNTSGPGFEQPKNECTCKKRKSQYGDDDACQSCKRNKKRGGPPGDHTFAPALHSRVSRTPQCLESPPPFRQSSDSGSQRSKQIEHMTRPRGNLEFDKQHERSRDGSRHTIDRLEVESRDSTVNENLEKDGSSISGDSLQRDVKHWRRSVPPASLHSQRPVSIPPSISISQQLGDDNVSSEEGNLATIQKLRQNIKELHTKIARQEASEKANNDELGRVKRDSDDKIKSEEQKLFALKRKNTQIIANKDAEIRTLKNETTELRRELADIPQEQARIHSLCEEISKLKDLVVKKDKDIAWLKRERNFDQKEMKRLEELANDELKRDSSSKDMAVEALEQQAQRDKDLIEALSTSKHDLENKLSATHKTVNELRLTVDNNSVEIANLTAANSALQEDKSNAIEENKRLVETMSHSRVNESVAENQILQGLQQAGNHLEAVSRDHELRLEGAEDVMDVEPTINDEEVSGLTEGHSAQSLNQERQATPITGRNFQLVDMDLIQTRLRLNDERYNYKTQFMDKYKELMRWENVLLGTVLKEQCGFTGLPIGEISTPGGQMPLFDEDKPPRLVDIKRRMGDLKSEMAHITDKLYEIKKSLEDENKKPLKPREAPPTPQVENSLLESQLFVANVKIHELTQANKSLQYLLDHGKDETGLTAIQHQVVSSIMRDNTRDRTSNNRNQDETEESDEEEPNPVLKLVQARGAKPHFSKVFTAGSTPAQTNKAKTLRQEKQATSKHGQRKPHSKFRPTKESRRPAESESEYQGSSEDSSEEPHLEAQQAPGFEDAEDSNGSSQGEPEDPDEPWKFKGSKNVGSYFQKMFGVPKGAIPIADKDKGNRLAMKASKTENRGGRPRREPSFLVGRDLPGQLR